MSRPQSRCSKSRDQLFTTVASDKLFTAITATSLLPMFPAGQNFPRIFVEISLDPSIFFLDFGELVLTEFSEKFQVIFPLMRTMLATTESRNLNTSGNSNENSAPNNMEERRTRGFTLLKSIYLQYMYQVITLPNFEELWLEILGFMEAYGNSDNEQLVSIQFVQVFSSILFYNFYQWSCIKVKLSLHFSLWPCHNCICTCGFAAEKTHLCGSAAKQR
jgi:hypothetical protein